MNRLVAVVMGTCMVLTLGGCGRLFNPSQTLYVAGAGSGLWRVELDQRDGHMTQPVLAGTIGGAWFVGIHPSGNYLYAVDVVKEYTSMEAGSVVAFAVEEDGQLRRLNAQSSMGAGPAHNIVDPTGRNVLVANYLQSSVACLPIGPDGRLSQASAVVKFDAASKVNPQRQEAAHAHSIVLGPGGKTAFVADLGGDRIYMLDFDPAGGTLRPHDPAYVNSPPGGGPRHLAFHPSGKFAYANNELTGSVTFYRWDGRTLTAEQTVSTLPADYKSSNTTSEVLVHPGGRFVYVANRGHDSIAGFEIDGKTGRLTPLGQTPTAGKVPRNFAIDPTGRWMVVCNEQSGEVRVLAIDRNSGALKPTGHPVKIPKPVCARFTPR